MKERKKRNWNPEDTIGLRALSESDMETLIMELAERLSAVEERLEKLWESSWANPENDPFAMPYDPGLKVCRYCSTVMGSEAKICNTCGEPI